MCVCVGDSGSLTLRPVGERKARDGRIKGEEVDGEIERESDIKRPQHHPFFSVVQGQQPHY